MSRESNQIDQIDRSPDDLLKYPSFNGCDVVLRWSKDWWDGPLNGSISYEGTRYWFDFYCDTDEPRNPYYYLVYRLTEAEADFADRWSVENKRIGAIWGPLANDSELRKTPAFEAASAEWKAHIASFPNYSDREPVAWFDSRSNRAFYPIQVHYE